MDYAKKTNLKGKNCMVYFHSEVLTTKPTDAQKWHELVNKCPTSDVFFTPEYALLSEATRGDTRADFGGEAQLFFYGDDQNYVIYPLLKRRIGELPFTELLPPELKDSLDIISPYGYSGPLPHITNPDIAEELCGRFLGEFHQYCIQNNIVAEFVRLHPFIKNHLFFQKFPDIAIKRAAQVVYINLRQDITLIKKNFSRGNKSSIEKARNSGLEIRCSKTQDDIDSFYHLYTQTMERNKARSSYFFSKDFFYNLFKLLGDNVELFSTAYQGRVIGGGILLLKDNIVHYYLGGSDADFLFLRPNNFLFYQAILWVKERGCEFFNLGGGHSSIYDSLFRFKTSFSETTADFYTYSRVHNEGVYRILCQARDNYDELTSRELVKSDYFPEYRRQQIPK